MRNQSTPNTAALRLGGAGKIKAMRFLGISLPVLFFAVFASYASAIEYGDFGGRPAYPRADNPRTESIFVHTLNPGDIKEEGVLVVNNSTARKTILVYAVDSTPATDGAFACEQLAETKDDVGAWITLAKSEVTLDSGTNEVVPFTIAVPGNASVGEHNGCIITQEKVEKPDNKSGVSLSFRTGLRVAITIPGELERKLEIAGFVVTPRNDGGFLLQPKVKNLGNVSIDADVRVVTKYFFGSTLITHGGQYPILRGDTSDWNFELKKPFWGGWYRSVFTVEYDGNPEAGVGVKSGKNLTLLEGPMVWFFSTPTTAGMAIEGAVLLLIAIILVLCWLSRRRKNWIKKNWVEYEIKSGESGEDVKSLAERFGTSWKLVVKANNLQPPYALQPGQKIKVPPAKK
ncbi:MAG: LysM peptidoglycan-binding domain-containing protein [Patescibacteria group bacterium]|nr:LysM peptidoglycan-binding domain-containing protein [Patescibacteria group bacterium]